MRKAILMLSVLMLVLASCRGGGAESAQSSSPSVSPSAATVTSSPTPSPTLLPTPEIRTDYDLPPWSQIVAMYDYDTSEPLGYRVLGKEDKAWMEAVGMDPSSATVYDVTYQSSGHAVPAWLLIPDGAGPFPVVIFEGHYYSEPWEYVPDAAALARDGYAGLVIGSPGGRRPCFDWPCWNARKNIATYAAAVVEARRGVDLLETLSQIDATRVGYVGGGSGATTGGILAGVEPRIDSLVWQCGDPYVTETARLVEEEGEGGLRGPELARWQDAVAVLNARNYVGHARGTRFLLQVWGGPYCDVGLRSVFRAILGPKALEWYESEGQLAMGDDLRAWLRRNV